MLTHGVKAANLPDILVSVRADSEMFARRGGWKYFKQDIKFQVNIFSAGFINKTRFCVNILIRGVMRSIPNKMRIWLYHNFLREHVGAESMSKETNF